MKKKALKAAALAAAMAVITGGAYVCGRWLVKHYGVLIEQAYERAVNDIEQAIEDLRSAVPIRREGCFSGVLLSGHGDKRKTIYVLIRIVSGDPPRRVFFGRSAVRPRGQT